MASKVLKFHTFTTTLGNLAVLSQVSLHRSQQTSGTEQRIFQRAACLLKAAFLVAENTLHDHYGPESSDLLLSLVKDAVSDLGINVSLLSQRHASLELAMRLQENLVGMDDVLKAIEEQFQLQSLGIDEVLRLSRASWEMLRPGGQFAGTSSQILAGSRVAQLLMALEDINTYAVLGQMIPKDNQVVRRLNGALACFGIVAERVLTVQE